MFCFCFSHRRRRLNTRPQHDVITAEWVTMTSLYCRSTSSTREPGANSCSRGRQGEEDFLQEGPLGREPAFQSVLLFPAPIKYLPTISRTTRVLVRCRRSILRSYSMATTVSLTHWQLRSLNSTGRFIARTQQLSLMYKLPFQSGQGGVL